MEISQEALQLLEARRKSNDAAQRMERVGALMTPDWQRGMDGRLKALKLEASSARVKVRKLYALLDEAHEKRGDNVACKRGCNACCHMQVEMVDVEAELVAGAIGRCAVRLPAGRHTTPINALGRRDTPCTFLVNGECSIYDVRPFVCRDMAVLDVDSLTCSFENMHLARIADPRVVPVPQATVMPLKLAFTALVARPNSAWADIRQFFPFTGNRGSSEG